MTDTLYRCAAGHFFVRACGDMFRLPCYVCYECNSGYDATAGLLIYAHLVTDPVFLAAFALGGIEAVCALNGAQAHYK